MFNVQFKTASGEYVFNTLSGALVKIDSADFLERIIAESEENENFGAIKRKGFIVRKSFDEFGYILQMTNYHIYNKFPQNVSYTILTNRNCNFNCFYCFEHNNDGVKLDVDSTYRFIKEEIRRNPSLKHVRITWFGGEPLLNRSPIEELTDKLTPVMEERKIRYTGSVVTNGSCVDAEFLKKNKITSIQITLDGEEQINCRYKGISPDMYRRVVSNIEEIANEESIELALRLNCDRNNTESVFDVISMLESRNLLDKMYVYLAPIYTETEADLSDEEFSALKKRYNEYLKEKNHKDLLMKQLHKSRFMSCGFMGYGSYVIDADGTLKKCERDVGIDDKIIGNTVEGKFYNSLELSYQENDIIGKCKTCTFYPLCRGGCRNLRDSGKQIDCEVLRKEIIDLLQLIAG